MPSHNFYSALDRHAVLSGSDSGFPWYAGAMLTGDSDIARMPTDGGAGPATTSMVREQIAAAFEAVASWLAAAAGNGKRIPAN